MEIQQFKLAKGKYSLPQNVGKMDFCRDLINLFDISYDE